MTARKIIITKICLSTQSFSAERIVVIDVSLNNMSSSTYLKKKQKNKRNTIFVKKKHVIN